MTQPYAVFCGVGVGKGEHHAVGLDPTGKRLFDKALPNDESRLRAVFDKLATHGRLLIVVDQPNTIGALPVTVARTMPHTLRRVDVGDESLTELGVPAGFDDDLAGEATRTSNRIRGLLTGIHPALERVLGPRNAHPAVLEILARCGALKGSGPRVGANSPPSPPNTLLAWAPGWSRRSWPRSRPTRSPFPAP